MSEKNRPRTVKGSHSTEQDAFLKQKHIDRAFQKDEKPCLTPLGLDSMREKDQQP